MRILALAPGHAYGGAEVAMRYVLDAAVARDDGVVVGAATPQVLERFAAFPNVRLGVSPQARWRALDAAVRITALCRREMIDLVYTCHRWPTLLARPAGRICGIPVVYHCQSHVTPRRGTWWGDWTIVVSGAVKEAALAGGARAERVSLIPNPANPHAPELGAVRQAQEQVVTAMPAAASGFAVAVARLVAGKGIDLLLRALADVPGCPLVVVGDGEERLHLEALRDQLGLHDRVLFVGWQADPRPYIAAADFLVFPSDDYPEGLPLVVVDAMALARPVLATSIGGVPDAVVDQVTGVLVEPGDPKALAQGVRYLRDSERRREELGRQGYERVASVFAAPIVVDRVLGVFHTAVMERHS